MSPKKAKSNSKQSNSIHKKQCQSSNKKLILDQRANIKFCQSLGKSASEAWQMIQLVYGSTSISRSQVYKWYKLFAEGRQSLEDEPRSGRPLTGVTKENIAKATEINKHGKTKSLRELAEELDVSVGTCYNIVKITKVCT